MRPRDRALAEPGGCMPTLHSCFPRSPVSLSALQGWTRAPSLLCWEGEELCWGRGGMETDYSGQWRGWLGEKDGREP